MNLRIAATAGVVLVAVALAIATWSSLAKSTSKLEMRPSDSRAQSVEQPAEVSVDVVPVVAVSTESLEAEAAPPMADPTSGTIKAPRKPRIRTNVPTEIDFWINSAYCNPSQKSIGEAESAELARLIAEVAAELDEATKLAKAMQDAAVDHHLDTGNYIRPDAPQAKDPSVYVMKNGGDQLVLAKRALEDRTIVLVRVFGGEYPELDLALAAERELRTEIPDRVRTWFEQLQ